jgi:hypothetical protein
MVPDTLRTLAFGAIGAGYTAVGAVFDFPMRIVAIKNLTDEDLLFSFNGVTDHEIVPEESGVILDLCANNANHSSAFIAKGTIIYVKHNGVAPTAGSVAISTYYCIGD